MHISLQFAVIAACLVLLCFVLRLVLKDSLQLKYSLRWYCCYVASSRNLFTVFQVYSVLRLQLILFLS